MLLLALSATALATDLDFACGSGGPVVGLPPLTVNCVADPPLEGSYDEVSWLFGDGGTGTGLAVSHTYEREGQFTVSARLEGWVGLDSADSEAPSREVPGLVTVCGAPEPFFRVEHLGGLDLRMHNLTPPDPGCIEGVEWDVLEGEGTSGDAVLTIDSWEPEFTLPDEGPYTIVLTVGGIGGTRAWKVELDGKYVLPDELHDGAHPVACETGPAGAPLLLWPGLWLVSRRRRR